ncbi:MAG: TonB-dependent receptor [Saprospiraceae bacterium]|nr:TonB-dependent receptor [Saprospiraceae bacterium]
MLKKSIILYIIILFCHLLAAQKVTISGYIEDESSGEKLIGCNIYHPSTQSGTVSNTFGFYSITLDRDDVILLEISYIGYSAQSINISGQVSLSYNIKMKSEAVFDEIEITATKDKKIETETQMSMIDVPILQIKKIPALMGETDVLKALQLLPGVQSGGEGQAGLYVRGGSPDQNLILLDGVPVYNANHLFGFFSVFNAEAIKDVTLIKGGFPARYGGRLSSVLEINLKDGHQQEFHGDVSIGLVGSKLTLEGPINKGKTSFLVSGRRTYIDLLAKPFIKQSFKDSGSEGDTGYYFYDLNAKVNHTFSQRDRIYLSVYGGNDKFYFNQKDTEFGNKDFTDNGLGWGNLTGALRWNHVIHDKLFMNTTLTYSKYNLNTAISLGTEYEDKSTDLISLGYLSGIRDYAAKIDFDYVPSPRHFIRFGTNVIFHEFNPGQFNLEQISATNGINFKQTLGQPIKNATEMAMYVEDDFEITKKLKVNVGLHLSGFSVDDAFYTSLQPRFSARYLLPKGIGLKASFATMRQFINLLSFEGIGLPTDLWLPTTARVKPQESWQAAIGVAKTFGKDYEISVEAYYKRMNNLIAYKDGSGLFELSDWQDRITQGKGEAYGFEFFLQKKTGKLSGWIGYTLAWNNRQFSDLNEGRAFPYRYDRRHDLSIVAIYELSKKINVSSTWVYGTGNAVTLPKSRYGAIVSGENLDYSYLTNVEQYGDRNSYRMNAYHRLDIGINFIKTRKNRTRTWSIGAYNAYANNNPFFVYFDTDYLDTGVEKRVLKQVSLFPLIPYVTYSLKF